MKRFKYKLVEKNNHDVVYASFDNKKSANNYLTKTIPVYCSNGHFKNKELKPEDFEVIERWFQNYSIEDRR